MALVDIKNYLQGLLKLGYGNTSQTPIPTSAFPMDGRTYFESYEQAEAAAALAEQQGSKNTIFYFGMTLVVYEDGEVNEYIIVKDKNSGKGKLQDKLLKDFLIIDGGTAQDVISTGDVNGDGVVDNKDLTLLLRYVGGWDVEVNELAADVYQDGTIDDKDLRVLLAHLSDWDAPFDNLPVLPTEVSEEELPNLTSTEV